MIVKDEEPQLAGCLQSVQGLVSEIIIVDTGSTDKTKQIAAEYSAIIIDHKWNDDFSAARNVSLKAASYDWIIVLDADERLDKSDFEKIRHYTQNDKLLYKFVQRHYRNESSLVGFKLCHNEYPEWEKGWLGYVESSLVRLFPNKPEIEYRNCMHELVEDCARDLPQYRIVETQVRLHHYDHARPAERISWKNQLYTRLSAKKAELMRDHWKAHYEYGLDLNVKKQFSLSIAPLLKAHKLDPKQIDPLLSLGHSYGELQKYKEAELCFVQALKIDPKHFQAICHLGVVYMKLQKFDLAVQIIKQALKINPQDIGALLNLGEAYMNLSDYSAAREVFISVLRMIDTTPRALIGYAISCFHLARYQESESAFVKLHRMKIEQATAAYWLSEIYRATGRLKEAANILRQLIQVVNEAPLKSELQQKYESCINSPV